MTWPEFLNQAWASFRPYALETLAVAWGILTVWLTVKQNSWCWPIGSASNALFVVIFYREKLYADMVLQVIYIALNLYGWYQWRNGGRPTPLPVTTTPARWRLPLVGAALLGTAAITTYLASQTDASLPFWDAATTILSLVAQFMLAKKWIENWWVWISVNVLYIGLYAFKGLYLTSAQQLVFIALSIMGYLAWRKELQGSTAPTRAVQ